MNICGRTDVGKVRKMNQDNFIFGQLNDNATYALVCDGMGGPKGGNIASQLACNIISEKIKEGFRKDFTESSIKNLMITSIINANNQILELGQSKKAYEGMGTTVILVLVVENSAYITNVGDSRVYLLKNNSLNQLTTDHSIVQSLVEQGKITKEQAKTHPHKNLITRAVGIENDVEIDFQVVDLDKNEIILLCTDGLTNMCSDEQIQAILGMKKFSHICDELIKVANENGGTDNITAVVMADTNS